jgi:hypothetical protein
LVPFLTLALVSCKKDRTCTCVSDIAGSSADVVVYTKARKSDARAACLSTKYTNTIIGYSMGNPIYGSETITCTLK